MGSLKQLGFGLVTLPVKLVNATSPKDVKFNQITPKGNRTEQRLVDAVTGEEVVRPELRKGFEYVKDQYVILTPEEVEACAPEKDDFIEIKQFVEAASIDPLHFEKSYYLQPEAAASKPYALLVAAMGKVGKVGIAKAVVGQKEQLVAVRVVGRTLVLTTLYYVDEIKPAADLKLPDAKVDNAELALATQLIEAKSGRFDPGAHSDGYRARLLDLIAARATDSKAAVPAKTASKSAPVADLMGALKASVAASKRSVKTIDKPAAVKAARVRRAA